ncbi:MAG TPA: hypothetical protein VEI94_02635, partial [Candidatus Bathyarchaeia archaeon]|nr:hypothetical protein [Candidatus Bathyarchaeia archaeon]
YNAISTGNPLRPTQAMEIEDALSRAAPQGLDALIRTALFSARVALASEPETRPEQPVAGTAGAPSQPATPSALAEPQAHRLVQGGGLRLSHLPQTLPRNLAELRKSFGDLAVVCGLVGALATLASPLVFWLTIPYSVLALLVFSCWVRPDPRYLTGVTLLFSILVVEGVRVIAALPTAPAFRGARWRPFAVAAIILVMTVALLSGLDLMATDALPSVTLVLALALGLGLLRAAMQLDPGRARLAAAQVMAVGLIVVLVWRSSASWAVRASFQAPEVERARATLASALEPRAVVITSTDIGRPAENIDYYTDARAIYTGELRRWFTRVPNAAWFLARAGFAPYLLLPPSKVEEVMAMRGFKRALNAEVVAEIPPERAVDYFVASPFHRGVALELVRLTPRKRFKQRASP